MAQSMSMKEVQEQLRYVERQLKKMTKSFLYYHIPEYVLTGMTHKDGQLTRPGPAVTVCLGEIDSKLCSGADGKFVRGVAFCHAKDTPSRKVGRLHAARRVLRSLNDGVAPFSPTDETIKSMATTLLVMGVMTLFTKKDQQGNEISQIVAGDVGIELTESEKERWKIHLETMRPEILTEEEVDWEMNNPAIWCPKCNERPEEIHSNVFGDTGMIGCSHNATCVCHSCKITWTEHFEVKKTGIFEVKKLP